MRILLVENHARFARIVTQHFLFDHEVTVVPSIGAAREVMEQSSFDAALIDFDLDDGKGVELARELEALSPRPRLIAISSHDAGNDAITSAGADAVCNKMQFARIAEILDSISLNK